MMINTACEHCGEIFQAHSFKARYCSDAHRKAASRARAKAAEQEALTAQQSATVDSTPADPGFPIYEQTLAELRAVERDRTALGLAALALARQIDMLAHSPGALPGQLPAQFAAALARAQGNASGPAASGSLADIIGGKGGLVAIRGGSQ